MSAGRELHRAFLEWIAAMPTPPIPEDIPEDEWDDFAVAMAAAAIVTRETGAKLCEIALMCLTVGVVIDGGRAAWAQEWEARLQQSSE